MSINKDNLVKVDHPGDARIFNHVEYQTVNGVEEIFNTSLYWEDTHGELVQLKNGFGENLKFEGFSYRYCGGDDCYDYLYYERFAGAWIDSDKTLYTFIDSQSCGGGDEMPQSEGCKEIFDNPSIDNSTRVINNRDSKANKPGRVQDQYNLSTAKDLYYLEKKFAYDFDNNGLIGGNSESQLRGYIQDVSSLDEPIFI